LGDDAAAYRPDPGLAEVVTCDALVEGVHWDFAWCTPRELGRKSAAVNCSDIAAMGGSPRRAYLSLALPARFSESAALEVVNGLAAELRRHGARLAGGDTVSSPGPMMLALTLQGTVRARELVSRSGAQPGDWLVVTGDLGAAAAGLRLAQKPSLRSAARAAVISRLLRPEPRLREARVLARSLRVTAMLDISDGLAGDLRRLTEASQVGARVRADRLPISSATRRAAGDLGEDALGLALSGGEDYELLFTLPPAAAPRLLKAVRIATGTRCTVVGEIVPARRGLKIIAAGGRESEWPAGWEHKGGKKKCR
jgi:thiamine-monophosphate kinase